MACFSFELSSNRLLELRLDDLRSSFSFLSAAAFALA